MREKLKVIKTGITDPYHNLALEELLTEDVGEEEILLYLWQNRHTVVIGRNQNAYRECRIETLAADGGFLARRLSGGGAVYHDAGNLCFSFIAQEKNYDVDRHQAVLLHALRRLSLNAEKTGRNDLVLDGKKFSGHAFFRRGTHCCHHGTLMLDVDTERLTRYLTPDPEKTAKHLSMEERSSIDRAVPSVRSRVVNLKAYLPHLTAERLSEELLLAFSDVFGAEVRPFEETRIDPGKLNERRKFFADPSWILGRQIAHTVCMKRRFPAGGLELMLRVQDGKVADAVLYTDALSGDAEAAAKQLCGCAFEKETLIRALQPLYGGAERPLAEMLAVLIREELKDRTKNGEEYV